MSEKSNKVCQHGVYIDFHCAECEDNAVFNRDLKLNRDAVTAFFEGKPLNKRLLPASSQERKTFPMGIGLLDYFPDALAAVAEVSYWGNEKHSPGQPTHWERGLSMDHADCIIRHFVERGGFDGKIRHSAALAWRALALLQEELEQEFGLSTPRGARDPQPT